MSFCTFFPEKNHHHNNIYGKRERGQSMSRFVPFLFFCLATASIFSFFLAYSPNPFLITTFPKQVPNSIQNHPEVHALQEQLQDLGRNNNNNNNIKLQPPTKEKCDLFKGRWVPELETTTMYTNSSCKTIPESKNCFKNGRMDKDFLNWGWKPEKCELPKFDAKTFLEIVRGKKMAFIGDSVARNHYESLLCLLSQEETPEDIYKDSEDRFRKWYFPQHDFTLMKLWSKHLIAADELMVNGTGTGTFNLHLDKLDEKWAQHLPELDYTVISDGHWFFRLMYLYDDGNLTGCVYCNKPNVTAYDTSHAFRMAFRRVFKYINGCKRCKGGLLTMLRTFAPAHFENGAWDTGGYCNRTSPFSEREINLGSFDWKLRGIQVEEFEKARKEGEMKGKRFAVLDVTRAMLMRPDGHPGLHWGNQWMKGYNDCVHWCMPGPVDYWNHFLMEIIRNEGGLVS